jgi:hypothetical protein
MNTLMEKANQIYPQSESMRIQWIVQTIYLRLKRQNDMEPINQHAMGRYFYGHTTRK